MLTGFQLRASRNVLDLYQKDLMNKVGISKSTIIKLEKSTPNLIFINCSLKYAILLKNLFEQNQLFFNDQSSIELHKPTIMNQSNLEILTRFQFKAARIALRLSREELAKALGEIPVWNIIRAEKYHKNEEFLKTKEGMQKQFRSFFQSCGIKFFNNVNKNGITLIEDPENVFKVKKKT